LREARIADDVERVVLELHRCYGQRDLSAVDGDRLTDATKAVCASWNRFLADAGSRTTRGASDCTKLVP
jgi:hypothetical protein